GVSVAKYGDKIILGGEFYQVDHWGSMYPDQYFIDAAIRQFPEKCGVKTFAGWKGSMSQYLQVGDIVDEEMVDYFLTVLPPACWKMNLVQIGEPHSHINGRPVFATIAKHGQHWYFKGYCFRGEHVEPSMDL